MIGQTIAHYRILEKLGQGGMGEVYLADDTKLQRRVALKFLPESFRNDYEARERLLREARAASQLSHPNILTVHAVEEADGRDFIVMEYLDGQTLSDFCLARRPGASQSLELIRQIAEGLSAAHKRGIIHRDIKPANILVDADGHLKILDFGLAKQKGLAKLTRDGSTVGTMAYISPEQIEGREADARSDLFSLGVIAYEMMSGRRPFEGEHEASLVYAIAHEPTPPLAGVGENVQRIVQKLLAKKPEDRYQHASELLSDLRGTVTSGSVDVASAPISRPRRAGALVALGAAAFFALALVGWFVLRPSSGAKTDAGSERKMLAVLPFENLGPADQEYFADGMTEEITARLAGVKDLGVIARTSILQYKGTMKSLDQIGKELGVDYILEGTVRWQKSTSGPDQVRITPQLVRTSDATHVWAHVYDAVLDEVFTVQSNVARQVVDALNITMTGGSQKALESRPTENMQAYDLYLRGREYFHQSIGGTNERALRLAAQLYEQVIALDSNFAIAWAALSQIYTETYWHQVQDPALLTKALNAMERAAKLSPELPEVRIARGSIYYHEGNTEEAIAEFSIVEEQQPNNSDVILEKAYIHRRMGEAGKAIDRFLKAASLDPLADRGLAEAGITSVWNHDYNQARASLSSALSLRPDCSQCWRDLAYTIALQTGNARGALDTLLSAGENLEKDGDFFQQAALLAMWTGDYELASSYAAQGDGANFPTGRYLVRGDASALIGDTATAMVYYDSTRVVVERGITTDPQTRLLVHAYALAGLGQKSAAKEVLDSLYEYLTLTQRKYSLSNLALTLATSYVKIGGHERALDILEREFDPPSFINEHVLRLEPRLKPLHNEPRFQALLNRKKPSP